jgi:hypothetical protein
MSANTLRQLPSFILPQRFAQIKLVSLCWRVEPFHGISPRADYDKVWKIFASMPALEELRVEMHTSCSPGAFEDLTADEFYETWLGPLDALTQPQLKVFEVVFEKAYYLRFGVQRQGKRYRLVNAPEIDRSRPEHLSG